MAKLQRGEHCALGMILMGDRGTKQRHETIAQELIDIAFVAMDSIKGELEELVQEVVHGLCAELLGNTRRVRHIAEQYRNLLAFSLQGGTGREYFLDQMRRGVHVRIARPGLRRNRYRRRRRWCGIILVRIGAFAPYESPAILVLSLRMVKENSLFEVLEHLVIEIELAFERAIRNPATTAKQFQYLVNHLVKVYIFTPSDAAHSACTRINSIGFGQSLYIGFEPQFWLANPSHSYFYIDHNSAIKIDEIS